MYAAASSGGEPLVGRAAMWAIQLYFTHLVRSRLIPRAQEQLAQMVYYEYTW